MIKIHYNKSPKKQEVRMMCYPYLLLSIYKSPCLIAYRQTVFPSRILVLHESGVDFACRNREHKVGWTECCAGAVHNSNGLVKAASLAVEVALAKELTSVLLPNKL